MRYRKLNAVGDYLFGYAPTWLVNTPETVAQAVRTRLGLFTGEWFLDDREGLDLSQILGKNTQGTRDQQVQTRILDTKGVTGIERYESRVTDRAFLVTATINTVYGTTTIEVAL